jgi:hypothetical protein
MSNPILRRFSAAAALTANLALLAGCGGGTMSAATRVATPIGRAQITLTWPARSEATRLIPQAANSVLVSFLNPDNSTLTSQLLVRPQTTQKTQPPVPTTASFTNLPQGPLRVQATAFPNTDGTGNAQATAIVPTTIVAGKSTPVGLTMGTTIAYVDVLPHVIQFTGAPVQLTATAFDLQNNAVLTNQWQWNDSDYTVVSLTSNGATALVNGVGPGTATIIAQETESDKSFSKVLNVAPLQ